MPIREAFPVDFEGIWPFFHEIALAGETFAYAPETTREEGLALWFGPQHRVFVYEEDGVILGSYYLRPIQPGPGSHVCNCGYMVAGEARGKGVATALGEHSQVTALALGYKAMQYSFVVSTNEQAVRLWQKAGHGNRRTPAKSIQACTSGLCGCACNVQVARGLEVICA